MTEVGRNDIIQIEEITLKEDNFDEVATFIGAGTYTKIRSRLVDYSTDVRDSEFTTTGGMFSVPGKEAISIKLGKTLIRPILDFRDVTFIEPVDE